MSFDIALSGINAVNSQLDTISKNIANSGTYGYKASRANFSSMYAGSQATGVEVTSQTQSVDVGGSVLTTGRGLDVSIDGRGFFVSRDVNGATAFSRVGIFSVNADGYVSDALGGRVQGYAAVPNSPALGVMGDLRVPTGQIAARASDTMKYVGNLSADWAAPVVTPFDATDMQSFNSSMVTPLYDSLGTQHSLTQYFVKTGSNQVSVHYTLDGAAVAAPTVIDFGTDGQIVSPLGSVPLALGTPAGAAPLAINLDYTGTTQFAGEAVTTANSANGYASGTLTGVQIDDAGAVMASYSNGQKQRVGTIALATFPDEGSLQAISGTRWTATNASGAPLYFAAGTGMAGSVNAGTLEQSNVDITAELVTLMSAQRNYQANSKVISTQSQMIQSLMQAI